MGNAVGGIVEGSALDLAFMLFDRLQFFSHQFFRELEDSIEFFVAEQTPRSFKTPQVYVMGQGSQSNLSSLEVSGVRIRFLGHKGYVRLNFLYQISYSFQIGLGDVLAIVIKPATGKVNICAHNLGFGQSFFFSNFGFLLGSVASLHGVVTGGNDDFMDGVVFC